MSLREPWLVLGGSLSLAAGLSHLACVAGGPKWYRFFGAGEQIARAAERGSWMPVLVTSAIAGVLLLWAAYGFAAAGILPRLPLMRLALVAITAVYLARGLVLFFPSALRRPDLSPRFLMWSSLIVLVIGIVHVIGTWRAWPNLSEGT